MAKKSESKGNQTEQDQPKRSAKEYLKDTKAVLGAAKRMIAYSFKTTPIFTTGFLVTVFLISVLPFISAWINGRVLDGIVSLLRDGQSSPDQQLMLYIALMLLVLVVIGALNTINTYFEQNYFFDITRELTSEVQTKFSNLDIEYFEDPEMNNLLQKVKENYGHKPQQFISEAFWMASSLVQIISAVLILMYFSPLLILLLLITTLPRLVNDVVFGRRSWGIWGAKAEVKRDYWWTRGHLEREDSLMELRIFRARSYFLKKIYDLFYNFQKEQIALEKKRAWVNMLLQVLSAIGFGVAFFILVLATLAGEITIGLFSFYVSTTRQLGRAFRQFFRRMSHVYEHGLYVVDTFEVLDLEEKIVSGEVCLPDDKKPPLIEFESVTFRYPKTERDVITNLNLRIKPGEHIAIVGENGAGKTTLIKLLMRFYDVTRGAILADSIDIRDLDIESWYNKVGTLFQEFNMYHFDAKDNIGVGNVGKIDNLGDIMEAAKKSGAHDFIEGYEHQYDQVLSKAFGGIKPSFGQWQRIALARAFFKDAPILILDEPTSAIDPKAEFEIFERLFEFTEGKTVIIISHRFSTVRNARRIIVLDEGKIIEDGSHEELMKIKDGKYKTAFEIQRKGYE